MIPRQIGDSGQSRILYEIYRQFTRLSQILGTVVSGLDTRIANVAGRRDTSTTLDFSAYDDWSITCGASQQLTIINDSEGVFFKTFELTGGSLNAILFTHATKAITLTENDTLADYDNTAINDVVGKFVIGTTTIVVDIILKVRS